MGATKNMGGSSAFGATQGGFSFWLPLKAIQKRAPSKKDPPQFPRLHVSWEGILLHQGLWRSLGVYPHFCDTFVESPPYRGLGFGKPCLLYHRSARFPQSCRFWFWCHRSWTSRTGHLRFWWPLSASPVCLWSPLLLTRVTFSRWLVWRPFSLALRSLSCCLFVPQLSLIERITVFNSSLILWMDELLRHL